MQARRMCCYDKECLSIMVLAYSVGCSGGARAGRVRRGGATQTHGGLGYGKDTAEQATYYE